MEQLIIKEIRGNTKYSEIPPILVMYVKNPYNCVININKTYKNKNFYKVNKRYVSDYIEKKGYINYNIANDIIFKNDVIKIIFVNNNSDISKYSKDYIKIDSNIWKPIEEKNYVSLGAIYSSIKPESNYVSLLNEKFLNLLYQNNEKVNDNDINSCKSNFSEWETTKGEEVILVEPDDPWYINKNRKFYTIPNRDTIIPDNKYKNYADYKSSFGYSYRDRLMNLNSKKEDFENKINKSGSRIRTNKIKKIIMNLFILILFLFMCHVILFSIIFNRY